MMRSLLAVAALICASLPAVSSGSPARDAAGAERSLAETAWQPVQFVSIEQPLAATVLEEEIRTSDPDEMQQMVLSRLLDRYAEAQRIEVTEAEIDAFADSMQRGMRAGGLTAEDALTPEEAAQAAQMRRDMGRSIIRIIFQQLGPEPLDAYRRYLEERQAAGDFTIQQKAFADAFWRYFTSDSMHDFYQRGSKEEAQAFSIPPWERALEAP
jgi:hypothetical protein